MPPSEGLDARFRGGIMRLRGLRAVWIWLALLTVITLAVEASGGPQQVPDWFRSLGLSREGVLSGKLWQPLSYGLLHGNMFHLAVNCALLVGIGASIERMLGGKAASLALAGGVTGGGLLHLLLGNGLLVGISGGCVALLLLLTTLSPESRMFPLPVSAKSLGIGVIVAEALMTAIQPSLGIPGLSALGGAIERAGGGAWFQIGHACHLGGGIAGWVVGRWILRPRVSIEKLRRDRARRETRATR